MIFSDQEANELQITILLWIWILLLLWIYGYYENIALLWSLFAVNLCNCRCSYSQSYCWRILWTWRSSKNICFYCFACFQKHPQVLSCPLLQRTCKEESPIHSGLYYIRILKCLPFKQTITVIAVFVTLVTLFCSAHLDAPTHHQLLESKSAYWR